MNRSLLAKQTLLIGAALGLALAPLPASAGGRGHYGAYGRGHYVGGYYRYDHYRSPYYGNRYYGYRHRHRGLSGGEAALIAAGIIGGAILIDRAFDDRRDRYDPYEDDRRYRRSRGAFDDGAYYRRDDRSDDDSRVRDDGRASSARFEDDDADEARLAGGRVVAQSRPLTASLQAAWRGCVAETRGAAGAGGMIVAAPSEPERIENFADGGARMTARFRAENRRGESFVREIACEADETGVAFLEVG